MADVLSPGEEHDLFIEWTQTQRIVINGVAPARFQGRGIGIVAARDLKKGERLVFVPAAALLTYDTLPIKTLGFPKSATVHGRLAGCLALSYHDKKTKYRPWQEVWPSQAEFEEILPLNWDRRLQEMLPEASKELLTQQQAKLQKDWTDLQQHLPNISKSLFTYLWLIVNTRCFYWDYPGVPISRLPKARSQLTVDDCYAMSPFMDYFNHASSGCSTEKNAKGYSVIADRDYSAGEEIYVSYGPHTNDVLLVEYGFVLAENQSDDTKLDHLILRDVPKEKAQRLKEDGFYGKYTMSADPPAICHRTQAALRLLTLPQRRYAAFVGGTDDGAADQSAVDAKLRKLLEGYQREIMEAEEEVDRLLVKQDQDDPPSRTRSGLKRRKSESNGGDFGVTAAQKDVLARRWRQLRDMGVVYLRELE